jgi:serine/threonine protein phosphatase PrpC
LWALGQAIDAFQLGDTIAGRYVLMYPRILLDTQPGMPPETPLDIPANIAPYLRLAPYGLHLPQVYGRLLTEGRNRSEIWLLEDAPLYQDVSSKVSQKRQSTHAGAGQLLPKLTSVWKDAPAIRQLNWLWQVAMLWQPLSSEGVASSLLSPELLRVEGPILRLLELQLDTNPAPTLPQLGQLWSGWLSGASPILAEFLQQLCTELTNGQIRSSEQLVALLDSGLNHCGRSQNRAYQIFTRTDSGPSRSHNEDACYPPSGQLITPPNGTSALAIVCDGIGGHEGGEVASNLAIDTLRQQVEKLPSTPDNWNPTTLTLELEQAACAANDIISEQNDSERRSDRQRMGTTLVMARTVAHEIYITHVGDSRIYWITRHNCHQITLDDDLASREVRLGYALYRNAIQQPTSGSLVQALGMAASATLHPTVQRFVLDEDCVFLLCSDGLSDYDRVEQYWQAEILPVLNTQVDLATAGARLIEIANTQNGHDNATVALIHCKVSPFKPQETKKLLLPDVIATPATDAAPTLLADHAASQMKTQPFSSKDSRRRPWGILLGILVLLGLGGVAASILFGGFDRLISYLPSVPESETTSNSETQAGRTSSPTESASISGTAATDLPEWFQVTGTGLSLLRQNQSPSEVSVIAPAGSILKKIAEYRDPKQNIWLQLRVCSPKLGQGNAQIPPPTTGQSPAAPNPNQTQAFGWIRQATLEQNLKAQALVGVEPTTLTPAQQGNCSAPETIPTVPPSSPTPVPTTPPT